MYPAVGIKAVPLARWQLVSQRAPVLGTLQIASRDGAIVGTLDLFVMANLTRNGRHWAGIENVVVDVAHRPQGIGGALMGVAADIARTAGCYKLQLVSHRKRDAAHTLYTHTGFTAPVRGYRRYLER